jgi:hypothetical protein
MRKMLHYFLGNPRIVCVLCLEVYWLSALQWIPKTIFIIYLLIFSHIKLYNFVLATFSMKKPACHKKKSRQSAGQKPVALVVSPTNRVWLFDNVSPSLLFLQLASENRQSTFNWKLPFHKQVWKGVSPLERNVTQSAGDQILLFSCDSDILRDAVLFSGSVFRV